jgi:hypothetical protein
MKPIFYTGLAGLALFEILRVYFIMPMPGSQQINTIDVAYFLHTNRWTFRVLFSLMLLIGSFKIFQGKRKWLPIVASLLVLAIIYVFNFEMTAEKMFVEPQNLSFKGRAENKLGDSTVVIAVENKGEAKAYPLRYIVYHHQVRDTVGGLPVMVTYCSVCRTGRVYEPTVNGKTENFRLVGMDHFNAMFEDATTKSWWRQSTGGAITGALKGKSLPEMESTQVTLNKFFALYPFGKVMQPDSIFQTSYDSLGRFEKGKSKGDLTRRDSLAWKNKSWVVGLQIGNNTKAYDWMDLEKKGVINDEIAGMPIILALAKDGQSFTAFERNVDEKFLLRNDSLISYKNKYDFSGTDKNGNKLKRIKAYQEFWHSWQTFHPETDTYKGSGN